MLLLIRLNCGDIIYLNQCRVYDLYLRRGRNCQSVVELGHVTQCERVLYMHRAVDVERWSRIDILLTPVKYLGKETGVISFEVVELN